MTNAASTPSRLCAVPVVGLIGGIGSGKSAVAKWVADRHPVLVIDADRLGHQALDLKSLRDQLRAAFGDDIFDNAGRIVRSALGRTVFGESEAQQSARRKLESIVHPEIRRAIEQQLRTLDASTHQYVLLDAAVMLETGWSNVCEEIVFIDTPEEQRRERVLARGWSADELARREASQWPLEQKRQAATQVIRNDGSLDDAGTALWEFLRNLPKVRP
ncbi:MAG: dephospho-CoA kinase [Planctomycetaceae bacterium]|nr:dephospho-CoA kinase [Planctomycetaceae bacterium]